MGQQETTHSYVHEPGAISLCLGQPPRVDVEIYCQYRNGCEKVDISSTQGDEWESLWIGYIQSLSECGEGVRYSPQSKQDEQEREAKAEYK